MKSRLIWLVCVVFSTSKIARANKEEKYVKIPLDYHFKIGLSNNFEIARANKEGKDVKIPLDYTPRLAWAIMKVLIQPMLEQNRIRCTSVLSTQQPEVQHTVAVLRCIQCVSLLLPPVNVQLVRGICAINYMRQSKEIEWIQVNAYNFN